MNSALHVLFRLMVALNLLALPLSVTAAEQAPPGAPRQLYHGVAYYPELWSQSEIDDDIAEMKKLGINVVRMGEFAWAKMEPDEGKVSLRFFKRVMDKLHAAGIGTVFCTPTATPPIWLTDGHPERSFVDQDGNVMIHGARQHASYDHPDVEAACFRIVEAVAKTLGKHPGLVAWQIDNEFKCHVAEDFNPESVKRWHTWLEKRYGTIDKLNDTWGTDLWSERYQRFDQVPAPRKTPFLHHASLSSAYKLFSRERIADFMDGQSRIIRRYSSVPITHNMHLDFSTNLERMVKNLDFAAFDDYPDASNYLRMVLDADVFRAAKPGRPFWLMETSVAHNGWLGNHEVTHPPGFLLSEAVAIYGLGGEAVSYWLWRQQWSGVEMPHSAVLSSWGKPTIGYESVRAVEEMRRKLEPLMMATKPAPVETALTWSDRSRAFLQTEPLGSKGNTYRISYNQIITDWHRLLVETGLPRDVRFEGAPLDGLKLLVTPGMIAVGDDFLKRVRSWVEAGGVWVCGPITGARTTEHTVPKAAALGPIEKFAGVETVFSLPITGAGAGIEGFEEKTSVAGWAHLFRPVDAETKVLATVTGALGNGLALVTERRVGSGAVVMVGAEPQGDSGRTLLAKLINHCAQVANVGAYYTATPGTIVCPRVASDGRVLWLAVNLDGKGGGVELSSAAEDALDARPIPAGRLAIEPYSYRAVWLTEPTH